MWFGFMKNTYNFSQKGANKIPLKWSMIGMLGLVCFLPLLLISFGLLSFVSNMVERQVEKAIVISTDKAAEICDMQLNGILNASKAASYQSTIWNSYVKYQEDGRRSDLYDAIHGFLERQYGYDRNFLCTMVFLLDEPEESICYTYNTYEDNNTGTTGYARVEEFRKYAMEDVIALSPELDTRHALILKGGHFYLVRNLVGPDLITHGMIVMEISAEWVFESLESVWGALDYQVFLDGEPILQMDESRTLEFASVDLQRVRRESFNNSVYLNEKSGAFSYHACMNGQQELIYIVMLDSSMLISDVVLLRSLVILIAAFFAPLIAIVFWFFHTKVTRPIRELVKASGELIAGKYGHLVEGDSKSKEFDYLRNAFNTMSIELKYQFEQIYLEELARKDASIIALQSQINPHFLNNTLEIINWEARMQGDEKVTKMIEALSTMLNATMNRDHKRFVPLSEELEYVDAYLYIVEQRFGGKIRVEREIDSTLLDTSVPMLIVQPIVENAVKHGMKTRGTKKDAKGNSGLVRIHIYAEEDGMRIDVVNSGTLSAEDERKIVALLGEENRQTSTGEKYTSLGIRNVDQRLKIIYGNKYGLTIRKHQENEVISSLLLKMNDSMDEMGGMNGTGGIDGMDEN